MNQIYFSHPQFLWLWIPAIGWTVWLTIRSDASMSGFRKWTACSLRSILISVILMGISGFEWRLKNDDMNVLFLVDRSLSIPPEQQEASRQYINRAVKKKRPKDKAGVIVFGENAGIELMPNTAMDWSKFQAVIEPSHTQLGNAIRLATAAFPENAQKKLVILSDGNTDISDARRAAIAARTQAITIDAIPVGANKSEDVVVRPIQLPNKLKRGQTFSLKTVVTSPMNQQASMKVFRNNSFIGEETITLKKGENAFTFEEQLEESGFYQYEVQVDAPFDTLVQNNKSFGQTLIKGDPSILIVTESPELDQNLIQALSEGEIQVDVKSPDDIFNNFETLRFFDSVILSNTGAGRFNRSDLQQLHSLVKDFGLGLVTIGGDNSYTAGSYRGTPLEKLLPLSMNLDSKKVIPRGALVLVMHGMEFMNGNTVAREMALGTLDALGSEDEMGVLLWDGTERWFINLSKVGDKSAMKRQISGMNQGDLPSFRVLMEMGKNSLKESNANIKHIIVFSDGDPTPPTEEEMQSIRESNITVSSVLIAGHASDDNMVFMADRGNGNFYHITNPNDLPQIFLQETAIILKSAIIEETFQPQIVGSGEMLKGITQPPSLLGYVATVPKARASVPITSPKGDPIFSYWNYGLGKVAAFTSDARTKWASNWINWTQYRLFWQQVVQWSLRKIENSNLDINVIHTERGAKILIEALDSEGDFQNFLELEATILTPSGNSQKLKIQQTGPGQYSADFPLAEKGGYQVSILERAEGQVRSMDLTGTSLSYSPEFKQVTPNLGNLTKLTEWGNGRMIDPDDSMQNPYSQGRVSTLTPRPIWEELLKLALVLLLLDIGFRRIDLGRNQFIKAASALVFWKSKESQSTNYEATSKLNTLKKRRAESKTGDEGKKEKLSWAPSEKQVTTKSRIEKKDSLPQKQKPNTKATTAEEKPTSTRISGRLLEARRKAKKDKSEDL